MARDRLAAMRAQQHAMPAEDTFPRVRPPSGIGPMDMSPPQSSTRPDLPRTRSLASVRSHRRTATAAGTYEDSAYE